MSDELISKAEVLDTLDDIIPFRRYYRGEFYLLLSKNEVMRAIKNLREAESLIHPISYTDCANAMIKMWMENVVTDGEYSKIMDKLNTWKAMSNG